MPFPLSARFAHPEAGTDGDQKRAAEHLTPGEVYTVRRMEVGQSSSTLYLYGVPGQAGFNTVMFDAVTDPEDEPDPDEVIGLTEAAAAEIRAIAAARAASPALARSVQHAPLRSVYSICLRSGMDPADRERLEAAALVLHQARDQAIAQGGVLSGVLEEW